MSKSDIKRGISAYGHEQAVLLRLIRKHGKLTASMFDKVFTNRPSRYSSGICNFHRNGKPVITKLSGVGISGDSYMLGMGANGFTPWAWWLDLLQHMMAIDLVNAKTENGEVVYSLWTS